MLFLLFYLLNCIQIKKDASNRFTNLLEHLFKCWQKNNEIGICNVAHIQIINRCKEKLGIKIMYKSTTSCKTKHKKNLPHSYRKKANSHNRCTACNNRKCHMKSIFAVILRIFTWCNTKSSSNTYQCS